MANQAAFNPIYVDTSPFVWQPNAAGAPTIIPLKIAPPVGHCQAQDSFTDS